MNDPSCLKVTMDDSKGCVGLPYARIRRTTIFRFESGQDMLLSNLRKMLTALEKAGIELEGETGLRLKS
jgi:hypothetical protein